MAYLKNDKREVANDDDTYRAFAEKYGYRFIDVIDWTSSAGDWDFIVSKDARVWYVMTQRNNWPCAGFDRCIHADMRFVGRGEDVLLEIAERYY